MIDLHSHSRASDGSFSPSALVAHAASQGVSVLALTDHDTVAGNAEAAEAARGAGIGFVPGIELDIEWKSGECHMLGLGLKTEGAELGSLIAALQADRAERNAGIIEKMRADGIDIDLPRAQALAGEGTLGRPHFAQYLVEAKVVRTRQQAFDRFLARDRPYYLERKGIPLDAGISAIRAAGGVPILAHPLSLYASWGALPGIVASFRDRGIAGLEAWHPGARIVECERLEALAKELGLLVTAGSDFHGAARPDRKIGRTAGGRPIEDRFMTDELKALLF